MNGTILSVAVKDNPMYHDLHLVVNTGVNQDEIMQADSQSSSNGEFMKTDLQQVIYVKRKQNTTSELRSPEYVTL